MLFIATFAAPCRATWSAVLALGGLALVAGCAPTPVAHVSAVGLRTSAAAGVTAPLQATLLHIHSLPLYQEAEQACQTKRYAQAAALLQRLNEQKGLTSDEITFLRQQRVLCLQDAGLPVPSSLPAAATNASVPASSPLSSTTASPHSLTDADCGPRALLLLCHRLGVKTTLQMLRQKAGTTTVGTSLAGLATAGQAVGLKAEGVQVSREALPEVETPALAYVNGNHFLEIVSLSGKGENATAIVHDPNAAGEETISQERLLRLCSGYLLLIKR